MTLKSQLAISPYLRKCKNVKLSLVDLESATMVSSSKSALFNRILAFIWCSSNWSALCLSSCSYSLNNYCKQFLSQDGVGGLVGCDNGVCYVSIQFPVVFGQTPILQCILSYTGWLRCFWIHKNQRRQRHLYQYQHRRSELWCR